MKAIEEADVVVAGAGAGGMAAALFASLRGLDVVVLEKSSQVGGTTSTSAGSLWIPGNGPGRRAGHADQASDAARYLGALIGSEASTPAVAAFLDSGPEAIDELERQTEVRFNAAGYHPDYRDLPGAGIAGRVIVPVPFDGRRLGEDFVRVRPPIPEMLVLGGMMVGKPDLAPLLGRFRSLSNFAYAARLVLRYFVDRLRHPRGTRLVMGNALVGRMLASLRQRGVPVLFDSGIESLLIEDGRVCGVSVTTPHGTHRIRARRGVVLATGGFGHHRAMRQEFMVQPVAERSLACDSNTGDGMALGRRAGAHVAPQAHREGGLWTPSSITPRPGGKSGLYPHIILDRAKPGLIAVNAAGRRFVNEACSYHDFVSGMYRSHRSVATLPAWLVCDAEFVRKYGLGWVYPGTTDLAPHARRGYLRCAPTLAGLAAQIDVDAAGLQASVQRHNEFARTGQDLDFGKGSTEKNRADGDPLHHPSPCLGPIVHAPYVAMAVWPTEIATSTGLEADEHARVLDVHGRPIEGLYACGNDMASIFRGTYPGPGATLGPAVVFGRRAACHMADGPPEQGPGSGAASAREPGRGLNPEA